jgi:hypothetical protein
MFFGLVLGYVLDGTGFPLFLYAKAPSEKVQVVSKERNLKNTRNQL